MCELVVWSTVAKVLGIDDIPSEEKLVGSGAYMNGERRLPMQHGLVQPG